MWNGFFRKLQVSEWFPPRLYTQTGSSSLVISLSWLATMIIGGRFLLVSSSIREPWSWCVNVRITTKPPETISFIHIKLLCVYVRFFFSLSIHHVILHAVKIISRSLSLVYFYLRFLLFCDDNHAIWVWIFLPASVAHLVSRIVWLSAGVCTMEVLYVKLNEQTDLVSQIVWLSAGVCSMEVLYVKWNELTGVFHSFTAKFHARIPATWHLHKIPIEAGKFHFCVYCLCYETAL